MLKKSLLDRRCGLENPAGNGRKSAEKHRKSSGIAGKSAGTIGKPAGKSGKSAGTCRESAGMREKLAGKDRKPAGNSRKFAGATGNSAGTSREFAAGLQRILQKTIRQSAEWERKKIGLKILETSVRRQSALDKNRRAVTGEVGTDGANSGASNAIALVEMGGLKVFIQRNVNCGNKKSSGQTHQAGAGTVLDFDRPARFWTAAALCR